MKLDFSRFHPLMHWAFSRECWGWYGGPIQHIKLWWTFQFRFNEDDWGEPITLEEANKRAWGEEDESEKP